MAEPEGAAVPPDQGGSPPAPAACPACGSALPGGDSAFCEECGHRLTAPCVACGGAVVSADGYCESCGVRQPDGRDHLETELPEAAGVTDKGLRHARNEDAMALAAFDGYVVAAVCDGVSSSQRPEDASEAAADVTVATLRAELGRGADPEGACRVAVAAAAKTVAALAESPAQAPACTHVAAVVGPAGVTVCWVGDSRAYWLAGEASVRLSEDDSLATEMIRTEGITPAEALTRPGGHTLTRWLGADADVVEPHVDTFTPEGPGTVLVCSDGLWNYLPEAADLDAAARAGGAPLAAAQSLVRLALDAGGHDNITVVLVPVGGAA